MCDEITEQENAVWLSRRQVALGASALAMVGASGASAAPAMEVTTKQVSVTTPDGEADGVFVAPKGGKHPGVLLWPDIAGLRPAYETMAERLAGAGYAVLVVNPYYRSQKSPVMKHFDEWRTEEGRARVMPMVKLLTNDAVARDGAAFVAWLDQQSEVDTSKKIGTQGYCMSGPFTFRTAAASERVGAFASFHGGGLVTSEADSPHTLLAKTKAAALVCIAQNDHERDPAAKPGLEKAAKEAGSTSEIEVYPANHGWCALDSPVYDEAQAEKAWARLLATYAAHL